MEQSKSVENFKKSTNGRYNYRSIPTDKLIVSSSVGNLDDNIHQPNKKSKHSRHKKYNSSRLNKSNSFSPSPQYRSTMINNRNKQSLHTYTSSTCTSYGYIQSLPTSSTNHGWIYHPQYGMILFTYDQAVETARTQYNGYRSESESNDHMIDDTNHLYLPSNKNNKSSIRNRVYSRSPSREYRKYSGYGSRSRSPSPSPIPHIGNSNYDNGLSDINRLYVYQPVEFELANKYDHEMNDTHLHIQSPICNLSENEQDSDENNINNYNKKRNEINIKYNVISQNKQIKSQVVKRNRKYKGKKCVFNDCDEIESKVNQNNNNNKKHANGYKSQRRSRKSKYNSQQKQLDVDLMKTKHKLGPRPTIPVPLPPNKNKKRIKKQNNKNTTPSKPLRLDMSSPVSPVSSLILQPSLSPTIFRSSSRGRSRNRTNQKIARNVKVLNVVQNNDCDLYCFSPKGKHYKPIQLHQNKVDIIQLDDNDMDYQNNKNNYNESKVKHTRNKKHKNKNKKEKHVLYEIDIKPSARSLTNIMNDNAKEKEKKSQKSRLKMPKFPRLRKKSNSDTLDEWLKQNGKNKKLSTPFCPSMSQYYVKDACLLHWEGKNIDEIKQNGVKKCMTKKLFSEQPKSEEKMADNIFFSMNNDVDSMCDDLEEKINRLFNNNGGTIYIGIASNESDEKNENNNDRNGKSGHSKSSSFTFPNNHKKGSNNNNYSAIATVRNHIIVGVKLNSKMRYKLRHMIMNDILAGFTPQIPHLAQNCDLKFIPVISQNGKIISRYFVVKISIVAPILGLNGEKIQFRTKDGYAHVIDF